MTEIIEITPTSRLRVEIDTDATCPRGDWEMLTGFVKIRGLGDSRLSEVPAVHDDPTGRMVEAHEHFDAANLGGDMIDPEPVVARWASVFYDLHVEYDAAHGGYWFCDPKGFAANWPGPDYPEGRTKREQEALVIQQENETYETWARGEVYGVILERQALWGRLSDDGSTLLQGEGTVRETWEQADDTAIWGCYLDDEYTAQAVALEYFTLTDDERAALG